MPDAIITSTESTFGTISGTFAADQSTVTGTIAGVITGTLTGSVGVPGPAGPQGEPGEGVPAGGTEGQIIVKASETDYDTVWVDNSAETLTAVVRNETGATLTRGTVVYISGAAGNKALVSKASASSEAGSSKTFAILKDDILNNQNGVAVTVGLLKGLNTLAFTEGANLWLSTTPGEITQTPPASPNHAVFLGNVTRVHANQGTIEVRIQNGYELGELHDVLITSPTNGQVLKYDSATSLWKNGLDAGLPAGGTAGQFLQKIDGVDYNTDWVTVNLGNYLVKSNNLSDLTDFATARDNLSLGVLNTPTFAGVTVQGSGANVAQLGATFLTLNHTGYGQFTIQPSTGITFPDTTVQTTAFPAGSDMPTGGMTGQVLTKQSNGNYDADWQTISTTTSWGSITGTLSNQTDLQSALDGKYSTTNPAGYITSAALSPYLTSATAASTYQTIAGMSSYLTTSAAAATYQTQAAMASYATESWVTSQGYLTDAPSDGNQYARKDGAWDIVSAGTSYITSVTSPLTVTSGDLSIDLTGYATESWVTSQGYITSVTFYPLTQDIGFSTSPDGRLLIDGVYDPTSSGFTSSRINIGSTTPSAPLNGDFWSNGSKFRYTLGGTTYDIASESYVTTRGYITSSALSPYLLSSTAASTYQTIAGMSSYLTTASAASTYQTISGMSSYLTTSAAASTYLTQANAASTYFTIASAASKANLASPTFTGKVTTAASATGGAGFNIPHGTAPTSPVNGDIWTTTTGLFARVNSVTRQYVDLDGTQTINGTKTFSAASQTFGNSTASGTINIGTGATVSGSTKALNIGTGGVAGSTTTITIGSNSGGTSTTTLQGTTNGVTAAADTNSTALATTAFVVGQAGSATPLVDGTAAVGTSLRYARQDHVHPTDTSRAALASPTFTGTPAAPTAAVDTNTTQIATTAFVVGQGYAKLASPALTGTPTAPTATAGTNTTQIATTAFVTAAVPALATLSDARQFTNDTKAMSPRDVIWSMLTPDFVDISGPSMTVTNTGTITYVQVGQLSRVIRPGTAGACSSRIRTFGTSQVDQTWTASSRAQPSAFLNFSLRSIHSGRSTTSGVTDANYTCAFYYGKAEADGVGNLVRRGFGWKMVGGAGSRFLELQVHNGTTLTSVTSSFAVTAGVAFDWDIESDGAGNVTLYVNGTSRATSSAGPTGSVNVTGVAWQEEVVAAAALSSPYMDFTNSRGRYIVINTW